MDEILMSEPEAGVAVLHLNRPARLNAMTVELVDRLHQSLDQLALRADIRVVVLTGSGRGFCAGLDLTGYGTPPAGHDRGRVERAFATQKHIAQLIPHMRSIPQPIIAAVNGPAAGGGFALVLGSDVRIAANSARFNAAFIRIGLSACDIGTSWLLPRLVGAARAHELMLTGRIFDANEALEMGLLVSVVPGELLMQTCIDKAREIARNSPIGVQLTKEAMWSSLEIPGLQAAIDLENRQQIMVSFAEDATEGMRAFMEKRPPRYSVEQGITPQQD